MARLMLVFLFINLRTGGVDEGIRGDPSLIRTVPPLELPEDPLTSNLKGISGALHGGSEGLELMPSVSEVALIVKSFAKTRVLPQDVQALPLPVLLQLGQNLISSPHMSQ